MIAEVIFGLLAAHLVWSLVCLESNARTAARMGLPFVRTPIDEHNVLWVMTQSYVWLILDSLPVAWTSYPDWVRYLRQGWHFREKNESHLRHGSVWVLVSPAKINLQVSDPSAIEDIFARRKDFIRPPKIYKILEVFGPCISTVDVDSWPRHRKAVAMSFNEGIMGFVWSETLRQTRLLAESWAKSSVATAAFSSARRDIRELSLNILAATGFRKPHIFQKSEVDVQGNHYVSALQTILENPFLLMLVPHKVLSNPAMPARWRRIGRAAGDFKFFILRLVREELDAVKQDSAGSGGMLSLPIKSLEVRKDVASTKRSISQMTPSKGLSVEEVMGNLYLLNLAGHDTTASALSFAIYLLASKPAVQDWIAEEINELSKASDGVRHDYNGFGNYLRCRAVLYETLRLYPPIVALPRTTSSKVQSLRLEDRDVLVPPDTGVTLSILACQTDASCWEEPLTWKPSRWIMLADEDAKEKFYVHPKGKFFPWSDGPQNCPGKKFSEVEVIASLVELFGNYRLNIKPEQGESEEAARERLSGTINHINLATLLRMEDAEGVSLVYSPKKSIQ